MTEQEKRERIVEVAKTWIGTPFHDKAAVKHYGVDCAYFPRAVAEESGVLKDVSLPDYSPQIMLHVMSYAPEDIREPYITTIKKYMREIAEADVRPGDVVVYHVGRCFSHGAIVVEWPHYILHPIKDRGVIGSHGTEEGFLKGRSRRFFSLF